MSKIKFEYSIGGNSWGRPGIYSRSEIFEIYPLSNNDFRITHYFKITASAGKDGKTFKKDTTEVKFTPYPSISKRILDSLYLQLNTMKKNFTYNFIRPRLKTSTKRQINKIAKLKDQHSKDSYYFDLSKHGQMINKIRDFDKLDYFINSKKPGAGIAVAIVDAWDALRVYYITNSDTEKYYGEFHQLLGQPFGKIGPNDNGVINLEINEIIGDLLPNSSLLKKRIEINSLTDEYIDWYLQEKY